MRDIYEVLGGKIRNARTKQGLTQADLAKRLSLSRSSVTNIENGLQKISLHDVYKLAETLDVDIPELLPNKLEVARSPVSSDQKIDSDANLSSREKKELKKLFSQL